MCRVVGSGGDSGMVWCGVFVKGVGGWWSVGVWRCGGVGWRVEWSVG